MSVTTPVHTPAAPHASAPSPSIPDPGEGGRRGGHRYTGIPLILLSGVGRSGTNALRAALSAHPHLDSTECENNIVHDLLDVAVRNRTLESRRFAMRTSDEDYDRIFAEAILSLLWPAPLTPPTASTDPNPAGALAYSNLTPVTAAELLRLFPLARIVYLVRNGLEVVASRMLYPAFAGRPFEEHCHVWNRAAEMVRWAESCEERRFFLVRHERIREELAAEMSRILRFCQLPQAGECLGPLGVSHIPTRVAAEDPAAAADLGRRAERARAWSRQQRETFAELCGEAMARLGYPPL